MSPWYPGQGRKTARAVRLRGVGATMGADGQGKEAGQAGRMRGFSLQEGTAFQKDRSVWAKVWSCSWEKACPLP